MLVLSWLIKELADGDAEGFGNAKEARGPGVDAGPFHPRHRLVVQVGARRHIRETQPQFLPPEFNALHSYHYG
jgi:hypothetical protein